MRVQIAVVENNVWQNQQKPSLVVVLGNGPSHNTANDVFLRSRHAQFSTVSEVSVQQRNWQLSNQGPYGFYQDPRQWATNYRFFSETNPTWDNPYRPSPRAVTDFIQGSDVFAGNDTFGWPEYPYPPTWVSENRGTSNILQYFAVYSPSGDVFLLKRQDRFVAPEQVVWNVQPTLPQSVTVQYIPGIDSTLVRPQAKWFDDAPVFNDPSQKPRNASFNYSAYVPGQDPIFLRPQAKWFDDPPVVWGPQPLTQNVLIFLPQPYNQANDPTLRKKQVRFDAVADPVFDNPMRSARVVWDVTQTTPPAPPAVSNIVQNWGGRVIFSPKKVGENIIVPVDFISRLAVGETILQAVVTCTVYSGTDPNPQNMIVGPATVAGTVVEQQVNQGVLGVVYELLFTVITSLNQQLELAGYFAVEPDLP